MTAVVNVAPTAALFALPPLPEEVNVGGAQLPLLAGAHLVHWTEAGVPLVGTLRLEKSGHLVLGSGDLYHDGGLPLAPTGIPIFPRADYARYLRVVEATPNAITVERYDLDVFTGNIVQRTDVKLTNWTGTTAEIRGPRNKLLGSVTFQHRADYLREALVEVDTHAGITPGPCDTVEMRTEIENAFASVGWKMTVEVGNATFDPDTTRAWSRGEMHAGMLQARQQRLHDTEWRYHVLTVGRIDDVGSVAGLAYDTPATIADGEYCEGAGVGARYIFTYGFHGGDELMMHGRAFARVVAHELGHIAGQKSHNGVDTLMCTTDSLSFVNSAAFPDSIAFTFSAADKLKLAHLPDYAVRPARPEVPILVPLALATTAMPGLHVEAQLVEEVLPIGAPLRIDLAFTNQGKKPLSFPAGLAANDFFRVRLNRGGFGHVGCHGGLRALAPGETWRGSAIVIVPTKAGHNRVELSLEWQHGERWLRLPMVADVMVSDFRSRDHAEAALALFKDANVARFLANPAARQPKCKDAIDLAMRVRELRPHFAALAALRATQAGKLPEATRVHARRLLSDKHLVISEAERRLLTSRLTSSRERRRASQ